MSIEVNFGEWLRLDEALDPATKASLEKADTRRFPDREWLKKAIEDMDGEAEVIPAPDAWRRLNALAAAGGKAGGKEDAALAKLAAIMPRGTQEIDRYIQMWRGGRMSAVEIYSLAFFASRGARGNELEALARDMTALPDNWRRRINFSDKPEISTTDGVSKYDDIRDFSAAVHTLAASDLDMSGRLEFDPKTDIRPERRKDLVIDEERAKRAGIWIYRGSDPTMCRMYGKGGQSKSNPAESPWCVSQTSNTHHYFTYRIGYDQTFFFIFDTNKSADDPARRVLAGVSKSGDNDEWSDMRNEQKINGYSGAESYKRYLAGKLGMSVEDLDEKMALDPPTETERKLNQYLDDYSAAQ